MVIDSCLLGTVPFPCRNRPRESIPTFPGFPCVFLGEEEEEEAQGQGVLGVRLGELGQRWSPALQQEAQAPREKQQGSQEEEEEKAQKVALG